MSLFSSLRRLVSIPLKVLTVLFVSQMPGMALPQGGQVTQGAATIQQESATKLNINQSTDRAVINWNSFSIGVPDWVNFQQPSSTSATLNRVTGATPSSIAGKLTANGQIFLINPNGIMFLPTARVDVAGLVASTLNIQDSDFMRNILRFEQMPGTPAASVVNQGLITVKEAGFAALVAPAVQNSGIISARLGKVVLASGTTVSLDFYGDGLVSVTVDPKLAGQITDIYGNKLNSLIDNQGNITAPGGIVTLTAQAAGQIVDSVINVGGVIQAKYAENRNGVIVLSGGSKGTVAVNGTLDVSGEQGGKVQITGENVGLFGQAKIDASGDKAGGLVFVGGDYLGGRADKQRVDSSLNAQNTFVSNQSMLIADAKVSGNGGEVIVWADNFTRFDGTISAVGDNGGFVETSGKNILEVGDTARVDTTGRTGKTGTWLLDPLNITINDAGPNNNVTSAPVFEPTGTGSVIKNATINTALSTNNVVVKTVGTSGGERGDVIFDGTANVNWATDKTFTVQAAGQILMNPGSKVISTKTGSFDAIVFEANTAGTATGNFKGIELNNATLSAQGGNIKLTGTGGNTGTGNFGILQTGSAQVSTTTGNITLTGTGGNTGVDNFGILQTGSAQVSTTTGNITYKGTGGNGVNVNVGVLLDGINTKLTSTSGVINITGTGKGTGFQNFGILQQLGAQVSTVSGDIIYEGKGAAGADAILISVGTNKIGSNTSGNITLTGDRMSLNNVEIQGKGNLLIQPLTKTETIGIGISIIGTLVLDNTELGNIKDGFSLITIGRSNGEGAINVQAFTFTDNLKIQNPNGGGIKINGALSVGINNLTLGSGGAVTQTKAITASGLELVGTGAFTLTNAGNEISTLAANTGGDIKYTDATGFEVRTVGATTGITATGKNVTLSAGGAVTQTRKIRASGLELLGTGAGAFTLTDAGNDVKFLAANTGGDIQYTDATGFEIGPIGITNGITTTQNVTLKAGDTVVQTKAITATGLELLGSGAFNLTNAGNEITKLAASTTNDIKYTDATGFVVDTVNTAGITATGKNVTLNAGGAVTQTQKIVATGLELLGTGAFTLTNAGNEISKLAASTGGDIKYTDATGFEVGAVGATNGITTTKNVTLSAGGAVTQTQKITASGLELLGDGAFTLTNTSNNVDILAGNTTNSINYVDSNNLTVSSVNSTNGLKTSSDITVESGGTLTVGAGNNGIRSSGGTTTLKASQDIILGTASNFGDVRGQKLVLNAGRDIIFDNITFAQSDGSGGVDVSAGRDFKIASAIAPGSLLNSNGGGAPINIKVGGTFTLDTGATSGIGANVGNITITADQMVLTSGTIGSTGLLFLQPLNAATTIGIGTGAVGTLNLDAAEIGRLVDGFSQITIGRSDGSGAINVQTSTFTDNLKIQNPVVGGGIAINGVLSVGTNNLTLASGGAVTQTQAITANDLTLIGTGLGSFNLGTQNNNVNQLAATTVNQAVKFKDSNGFVVGVGTDGIVVGAGTVTLESAGAVTQTQKIIASDLTLTGTGAGSFDLGTQDNNVVKLAATTVDQAVKFKDSDGFSVGVGPAGINAGTGTVTLESAGAVTQTNGITANGLELLGSGTFTLTNANNDINILAGNTTNNINYLDKNNLNVATVNSTTGLKTSGNITVESGGTLTVAAGINGIESGGGTTTLKASQDIILGTASNFGHVRGQKLVLNAGRDIIFDNITFAQSDGSDGVDVSAGRDFKIASAIAPGSLLNSNGVGAPINVKVGGIFTLNNGSLSNGIGANVGNITITADQMVLTSGTIGSNGLLFLQPLNAATTIGIGTGATGTLNLDTAEIGRLVDGFSLITIGRPDSSGNIDIRAAQFKDNVIIRTPSSTGIININGALSTGSGTETGSISLLSGESIIGANTGSITTQGKAIILHSDFDATNGGAIKLTGTTITSNGGNIILGGGSDPTLNPAQGNSTFTSGIELNGANLIAGAGNIKLTGTGNNSGTDNYGILQQNGAQVTTTGGNITYTGTGGNGTNNNYGIFLTDNNTTISTTGTGKIELLGTGNGNGSTNYGIKQTINAKVTTTNGNITYTGTSNGTGTNNLGIFLITGASVTSTDGNIKFTGNGGNGTSSNDGILLTNSLIKTTGTGSIELIGTGNGTENENVGIRQQTSAIVQTNTGSITYTGTGNGKVNNEGVLLQGNGTLISSTNGGSIAIAGTSLGTLDNNDGIVQQSGAKVSTTTGSITYTGTAGNGTNNNYGIFLTGTDTKTTTTTGVIQFTGISQGSTSDNIGILQSESAQVVSNSGNISYQGTGSTTGDSSNVGIRLEGQDTKITTQNIGTISLIGQGGGNGTGGQNPGIVQEGGAKVTSENGNISYQGTGGLGDNFNLGIFVAGIDTTITTTTGQIQLTGTGDGTGSNNYGVSQQDSAKVVSTSGAINYTGTGVSGADAILIQNGTNLIGNNTTGKITLTSTNNPITLNDVKVQTQNNIIITSFGDVTQNNNGGLFADGLQLNGAGNYTLISPNNDVNKLAANTSKNIQYTDANGFDIGSVVTNGINTPGNVTLEAGDTVTQTKAITAGGLELLGGGKFTLNDPANTITTIAADTTNDISFVNSQTLTVSMVNPTGITTTGDVFLQALTGNVVLEAVNGQISAKNITLVADSNFINNFGTNALISTGSFLVYATSPAGNVNGFTVLGGAEQFNTIFPQPALFAGNGFLYKVNAVLVPSLPSPTIPGLPNLFTEPVTFTFDLNDRQWRDLSDLGDTTLFPSSSLLCVNVPVNQSSDSPTLNDPIIVRNENLPDIRTRWQTGEFLQCPSPGDT